MKKYFGYIRVSTTKQGEQGSSLQEQKAAVEAYVRKHGLTIAEWFEEQETAASQGRPIFNRMLKRLDHGQASGIVTHKIDRSARNLKDWARLGELVDRGIELHFAHESIDLTSRSGRLSADILAVVAADYIRNLRDEVRKGFYGRLKQGLYPLGAPLGYLDQGGGKAKIIDPITGPLVRSAFELYRTGQWSLNSLRLELHRRGLRNRRGGEITRTGLSTILNNLFYTGIIKLRRTSEVFQGVHEPLIDSMLFDQVQNTLQGRVPHRGKRKRYRYQRLIKCAVCRYALIAELQKGHIYYRCHSLECRRVSIREDRVDLALADVTASLCFTESEWRCLEQDVATVLKQQRSELSTTRARLEFQRKAIEERLSRLTDAYVDGIVDEEMYVRRKEELLIELARYRALLANVDSSGQALRDETKKILELAKRLSCLGNTPSDQQVTELLAETTSNLTVRGKDLAVDWQKPFEQLLKCGDVPLGGPTRAKPRTSDLARIIIEHIKPTAPINKPDRLTT